MHTYFGADKILSTLVLILIVKANFQAKSQIIYIKFLVWKWVTDVETEATV